MQSLERACNSENVQCNPLVQHTCIAPHPHIHAYKHIIILFPQVCIPFLMYCLGLDPKFDLSQLSTTLSDLNSHRTISSTCTPNQPNSHTTPMSHSRTTPVSGSHSTPTPTGESTNKESGVLPSPQDRLGTPVTGHNSLSKTGSFFSLIASPRTPAHTASSKKHGSDRYQSIPSLPLVVSGCHALLQFLGGKGAVSQSLLKEGTHSECQPCSQARGEDHVTSSVLILVLGTGPERGWTLSLCWDGV